MIEEMFSVVDIETTGGSTTNDAITEIAVVNLWRGEVIDEWSTLVNPGKRIPPHIVELVGITDAMVADAPPFSNVVQDFLDHTGESVFVAHNVSFDRRFLKHNVEGLGLIWAMEQELCTLKLAKRQIPAGTTGSYKLRDLTRHYEVASPVSHRALADAQATARLLVKMIEMSGARNVGELIDGF